MNQRFNNFPLIRNQTIGVKPRLTKSSFHSSLHLNCLIIYDTTYSLKPKSPGYNLECKFSDKYFGKINAKDRKQVFEGEKMFKTYLSLHTCFENDKKELIQKIAK